MILLLGIAPFSPGQNGCLVVEGDRIVAGDFASSASAFSRVAPDTPLAAAPVPGARRIFHTYEINALARRYSLDSEATADICFERRTVPLDRQDVLDAMRAALGIPEAQIEIVETSLAPVPNGSLEFRREGLHKPAINFSKTPVEWHGNVIYGPNQRFSIWARVRVSAPVQLVVAIDNLKLGEPIAASQLRLETKEMFPDRADLATNIQEVVGRIPWHSVAKDAPIHLAQLKVPMDVNRGETVEVEIRSGAARLVLSGTAESAGRRGDTINIRNPTNRKLFRARVVSQGRAFLDAGAPL